MIVQRSLLQFALLSAAVSVLVACELQIGTPTSWAVAYSQADEPVVISVEDSSTVLVQPQSQGGVFAVEGGDVDRQIRVMTVECELLAEWVQDVGNVLILIGPDGTIDFVDNGVPSRWSTGGADHETTDLCT